MRARCFADVGALIPLRASEQTTAGCPDQVLRRTTRGSSVGALLCHVPVHGCRPMRRSAHRVILRTPWQLWARTSAVLYCCACPCEIHASCQKKVSGRERALPPLVVPKEGVCECMPSPAIAGDAGPTDTARLRQRTVPASVLSDRQVSPSASRPQGIYSRLGCIGAGPAERTERHRCATARAPQTWPRL